MSCACDGPAPPSPTSALSGAIPTCPIGCAKRPSTRLFARFDVEGPKLVAAHPQPNENAWLLGQALLKAGLLPMQQVMGMVGARGFEPPTSSSRTMRATKLRHAPTEMPAEGPGMIAGEPTPW